MFKFNTEIDSTKGILLTNVVLDRRKLGPGIVFEKAQCAKDVEDPTNKVLLWSRKGTLKPEYTLFRAQGVGVFLKGHVYITLLRKPLIDLDPNGELYRNRIKTDDRQSLMKKGNYCLSRAFCTHARDWKHIKDNFEPAVVSCDNELQLTTRFDVLLMRMYEFMDIDDELLHSCAFCNKISAEKLRQCSCRRGVRYCSTECQRKHWTAGHKAECSIDTSLVKK
jgi:hypothetical protein